MIIKDWYYAIKVCRKYKITWWPMTKIDEGTYYESGIPFLTERATISVNPFYRHFKEVFLHEVGHHIAKRIGFCNRYREYSENTPKDERILFSGESYFVRLDEEAFASRFARKAGKGVVDTSLLVKWFQTYTACGYKSKYVDSITLTNKVSKLIKRIEK